MAEPSKSPSPYGSVGWALARVLPGVCVIAGIFGIVWSTGGEIVHSTHTVYVGLMFLAMVCAYAFLFFTLPSRRKKSTSTLGETDP